MSICVLCEKPSQARDIANVLGARQRQEGFIEGNGYLVTWCLGHLLELAPPEHYQPNLQPWRLEVLPVIPQVWTVLPNKKTSQQLTVIKKLLKQVNHVIIATDADREGDVIGREVLDYCHYQGKIERLWLSALDDQSIKQAFKEINPNSFSINLYQAGLGRQRADWLVGMTGTMAATVQFSKGNGVLSVGRVQSPTLKLIVDRDFVIENFKSQDYYDLVITMAHPAGNFKAKWQVPKELADEEGHCRHRSHAEAVLLAVKNKLAQVIQYTEQEKTQKPPLGLSLSVLQKLCSSKFGFTAKKTLEVAQSLYETHKATTYPRTDCQYLPSSQFSDANLIFKYLSDQNKEYTDLISKCDVSFTSPIWNDKKITAHHAIIPTLNDGVVISKLTDDEKKLYDIVCRIYIAQFLGDYHYLQKEVELLAENEHFKASSHTPKALGWKLALTSADDEKIEDTQQEFAGDISIPTLTIDERLLCQDATIQAKQTKPLSRFTEGTLITAMKNIASVIDDVALKKILRESAGIGTEATRANIIETLIHREYIERKGKQLISTIKGRELIKLLPSIVTNPALTANWESKLDEIAQGKLALEDFMTAQIVLLKEMLHEIAAQSSSVTVSKTSEHYCTKCKSPLFRRNGKFGYFWGCSGYPECKEVYKDNKGKPILNNEQYACHNCREGFLQLRSSRQGKFWGCSTYPICQTIVNDKRGKPESWR